MSDSDIQKYVDGYIEARKSLLNIGARYPERIGGNDNIIGRIGEFIALQFLESLGQNPKKVQNLSNPGYDFIDINIQTQVKVITSENKNGKSVRLKKPWNQFVLMSLDEDYKPKIIGIITDHQHQQARNENPTWSPEPVTKLTMLGSRGLIGRYGKIHQF